VTRRLVLAALVLLLPAPVSALEEQIGTIPSRPDVTESFVLIHPSRPPVASVVLFMGGRGALGLQRGPLTPRNTNFLVRTRQRFAEKGFLVAVVDVPSDRTSQALVGFRTSAEHATDVRALIATLHAAAPVPVWLVGTSMGSVSAANAAARLSDGGPDGIVLTSSVMGRSREMGESLQDVALDRIRVPVLIVHHRDDTCPPAATPTRAGPCAGSPRPRGKSCWRFPAATRRSRRHASRSRRTATSASKSASSTRSRPGSPPPNRSGRVAFGSRTLCYSAAPPFELRAWRHA
jgi:hypothetical protein